MRVARNFLAIGALAAIALPAHAIVVTPTGNATTLANTLLGPGITLVGLPTLTGGNLGNANSSAATFTNGLTTGIGIDQGVLLTTGQANLVTNSNTGDSTGASFGGPGDAQLTGLAGVPTYDATVLSFNFTTTTGDLYFQFAFGSDEYNEYANGSVNDTFGFFVDGTNIALLPSTNTPISINTVNGGNPYGSNAQNPQYFNNNDNSDGGPFYAFSYDGFTDVFTVSALGLNAGIHTIKLAIADGGDSIYDSGVFIKAGSFSPTQPPGVPDASGSLLLLVMGFASLIGMRRIGAKA
jgi:hypothetical protein